MIDKVTVIEHPLIQHKLTLMRQTDTNQFACATTAGAVLEGDPVQKTADFPSEAQLCDDFTERAIAAIRTYKRRPVAQSHIPLGTTRRDFNYSTERKRILNSQWVVKTEDNVKQHEYTHKVL